MRWRAASPPTPTSSAANSCCSSRAPARMPTRHASRKEGEYSSSCARSCRPAARRRSRATSRAHRARRSTASERSATVAPVRASVRHRPEGALMIRYVAFYTLLFCVPGACASAADAFDRKPWLEDYAYLKRALASAADEADAKAALLGFIGAFHGHTAALPALAPAVKSAEPPRLDFAGLDAAAGCAALGFGSTKSVAFSLPFESLPGFTLVADGSARSFRTGVASAGGKRLGLLRIPYFRPAEYLEPCLGGWRDAAAATADPAKLKERLALRVYATVAERLAELARR